MNSVVRIPLSPTPEQVQRLLALQQVFARACNSLAPLVQETRIWNRVALHHLAYRKLRAAFPEMGSQMVCNAIYSVSRAARLVFQTPGSPFHHTEWIGKPLPLLHFTDSAPVYFDRHTLSLKLGQASMYTLDGRMRFQLALEPQVERAFHERKLLEIVLLRRAGSFELRFVFGTADGQVSAIDEAGTTNGPALQTMPLDSCRVITASTPLAADAPAGRLPDYLFVETTTP
jgi:hypothetical protein